MRLVIVRHGDTEWTVDGRFTGTTDVGLTDLGRHQAASLTGLLQDVLHGERPVLVSSPRRRATDTAALALPAFHLAVAPRVAEYDYGDFEGLTTDQIRERAPGWDIWRDRCPHGESTDDVGRGADAFLRDHLDNGAQPVVVVTHGHSSRIVAAQALGLAPEPGRLFASATASVSLIEDHHGERCVGLWNADVALLAAETGDVADPTGHPGRPAPDRVAAATGALT